MLPTMKTTQNISIAICFISVSGFIVPSQLVAKVCYSKKDPKFEPRKQLKPPIPFFNQIDSNCSDLVLFFQTIQLHSIQILYLLNLAAFEATNLKSAKRT